MNRVKALWVMCIFALAVAVVLGCSDSGGGPNPPSGNEAGDKSENAAGKTNDGHDLLVFDHGILDEILFKTDTVYITDTSFLGRLYFRNLPANKTPEPGDIINSAVTKKAPYGFLYRVVEVTREEGDVTIVYVNYASIAEAVEEADIEFEIPLVYDDDEATGQILAKNWFSKAWNTVVKVVNAVVDVFAGNWDIGGTNGATISLKDKGVSFGDKNNGGEVKLSGSYTLALVTKIKLKNYNLDYAKMSIMQNRDLALEGNLKGSLGFKKDYDLARISLPDISFAIGPVIVYLKNDAIIKAKIEANVQAKIDAKLFYKGISEYGFEYSGGNWTKINTSGDDFGFDYKYSIYGTFRQGVLMGLTSMFYGVAGLELSVGPSLVLKSPDLLHLSKNSESELYLDLDIDMKVRLEFLDFLKKSWDFGSVQLDMGRLSNSKTLPSFKEPQVSTSGNSGREVKSEIKREALGFQVENYGICVGESEDECEKGGGTRQTFGAIADDKTHEFTANFGDLSAGTYYAVSYFESSIEGDIHYDKATVFVVEPNSSSSSEETSSSSSLTTPSSSSVTTDLMDSRDGQVYRTTVIGTQTWMAQNLNYSGLDYSIGVCGSGSGSVVSSGGLCDTYGRLYDWETARIACPAGWHLPSQMEWTTLVDYLIEEGGEGSGSGVASKKLKATSVMDVPGYGTDDYEFSALMGGYGEGTAPFIMHRNSGGSGFWWSDTEDQSDQDWLRAFYINMRNGNGGIGIGSSINKSSLLSVRCIKD
ncbi:MAG: hypothetical protein LBQ76_08920 [Candidatus Fibromonas sp.]|jgi:uncharacterized protein (TIGR02145 family)|nr:hypothetical protein [Candidatus Fibromonas sp.]